MENDSPTSDPAAPAEPAAPRSLQIPTNMDSNSPPAKRANRLSINTTARPTMPPSPAIDSPHRRSSSYYNRIPKSPGAPLPSPLNRSASSLGVRPASPALSRRSSIVSLQGAAAESTHTPRKSVSRRTSGNLRSSSSAALASPRSVPADEPVPLTAQKVASDYFAKELEYHKSEELSTQTVVILHDACYGHRFSRPKSTKSALSMIVERPERIHAGILGISTAYVRFAERHAGGPHAPHPKRDPPKELPFTIRRTSRALDITSPIVTNVHGTKWMAELQTMCNTAAEKLASNGKELARTDEPGQPAKEKFHEGDLYLASESLDAFQGALGGVCDGIDAVFSGTKDKPRNAFVCVRPPGHHCSADFPSGFCWLNNVHVGIEYAAQTHGLTHAAIIDFDLHHGDGSQAIAWERNAKVANMPAKQSKTAPPQKRTQIGYFSLHDINSYPCEYGEIEKVQAASLCIENAHGQTVWNVHLQPWKTEEEFWQLYETRYLTLLEKARVFLRTHSQRLRASPTQPQPKAAIFISAGFDASEWEGQGMQRHKVNVPTDFYARFTQDIVKLSQEEGLGVDGRVISVLEGGYSDRALASGVLSHLSGLCEGQKIPVAKKESTALNGLGNGMVIDRAALQQAYENGEHTLRYNVEWWHEANLTALETMVYPPPPPAPKKQQRGQSGNFATPTQSFTAKVVDPEKFIRNAYGQLVPIRELPRPPTPPPPDVNWIVAAHELCKLLVPTDRQTKSFKPEELAEPRSKKEKAPPSEVPINPTGGRQLRERKPKVADYTEPPSDDEKFHPKSTLDTDRRRTIGDCPTAEENDLPDLPQFQRRQSLVSEIGSVAGERPSSRASTAAKQPANGLQVKKTRVPKTTKADTTVKPPPRPIASRASSYAQPNKAPAATKPLKAKAESSGDDVDQLTSGIKRITLKMPTREEHDARQAAAAAAEKESKKPAAPKATKKAPAARSTKTVAASRRAAAKEAKETKEMKETDEAKEANGAKDATESKPTPPPSEHTEDAMSIVSYTSTSNQSEPMVPVSESTLVVPGGLEPQQGRALSRASIENMAERIRNSFPPSLASPSELSEGSTPQGLLETAGPVHVPEVTPRPDSPPPPPPATMPQFIQYDPAKGTTTAEVDAGVVQQATVLQWLPPNSDPEAAGQLQGAPQSPGRKQKQALPVFTSNGFIPFAQAPSSRAETGSVVTEREETQFKQETSDQERMILDVPEAKE
ncbi:Histone deacetylase HOS3 [Lasiodiplodia theobromae]|uniref:Histone deacetylase HOS3 n=1 Tax=Lasiodiplodia theobromae TaxID=45133 RepID=A0A5N5DMI4_9PEZI|nr:Histone deacetylase HOS3 [Lasiodiplodia theobromae]